MRNWLTLLTCFSSVLFSMGSVFASTNAPVRKGQQINQITLLNQSQFKLQIPNAIQSTAINATLPVKTIRGTYGVGITKKIEPPKTVVFRIPASLQNKLTAYWIRLSNTSSFYVLAPSGMSGVSATSTNSSFGLTLVGDGYTISLDTTGGSPLAAGMTAGYFFKVPSIDLLAPENKQYDHMKADAMIDHINPHVVMFSYKTKSDMPVLGEMYYGTVRAGVNHYSKILESLSVTELITYPKDKGSAARWILNHTAPMFSYSGQRQTSGSNEIQGNVLTLSVKTSKRTSLPLRQQAIQSPSHGSLRSTYGIIQASTFKTTSEPVEVSLTDHGNKTVIYSDTSSSLKRLQGWQVSGHYLYLNIGEPAPNMTTADYGGEAVVINLQTKKTSLKLPIGMETQVQDFITPTDLVSQWWNLTGPGYAIIDRYTSITNLSTGNHITMESTSSYPLGKQPYATGDEVFFKSSNKINYVSIPTAAWSKAGSQKVYRLVLHPSVKITS